jgi:UDP-N-acetylmuramoyl-tripeptide--D-alanyl-D-alanine ligase
LMVQPAFVLKRNSVIKNAGKKLDEIRKSSGLEVIAITGSYGKTSTKEFLTTILSKKYKVLSTKEHQNSEIGIANAILNNLDSEHKYFIAETGAYNKGKIKEVCSFLKPKIGIVTGVNEQHLSLFGSLENLISAEGGGELDKALPDNGMLILNGDNRYCLDLYKKSKTKHSKIFYSIKRDKVSSEIWTEDVLVKPQSVSFVAVNNERQMASFSANVLGRHSIENLLAAILTANKLGMSFAEIAEACKEINQNQSGMVLKIGKHGINIIDSSYSSNPDGAIADLDYLDIFAGKKVVVMPCLIELGKKSSEIHEKIGKKIGKVCDLVIVTTKDKFKEIKRGAMWSGMKEKDILLCDNSEDIYNLITSHCKSGDAVLLEGRVPANLKWTF